MMNYRKVKPPTKSMTRAEAEAKKAARPAKPVPMDWKQPMRQNKPIPLGMAKRPMPGEVNIMPVPSEGATPRLEAMRRWYESRKKK